MSKPHFVTVWWRARLIGPLYDSCEESLYAKSLSRRGFWLRPKNCLLPSILFDECAHFDPTHYPLTNAPPINYWRSGAIFSIHWRRSKQTALLILSGFEDRPIGWFSSFFDPHHQWHFTREIEYLFESLARDSIHSSHASAHRNNCVGCDLHFQ